MVVGPQLLCDTYMKMLDECFNTIECNVESGVDNCVYGKEKVETNANRTETIYARCIKKSREGCKRRIYYSWKRFCLERQEILQSWRSQQTPAMN